ncbi:PP2C50, partial [Symbiodinium sp. CCMP2592]
GPNPVETQWNGLGTGHRHHCGRSFALPNVFAPLRGKLRRLKSSLGLRCGRCGPARRLSTRCVAGSRCAQCTCAASECE